MIPDTALVNLAYVLPHIYPSVKQEIKDEEFPVLCHHNVQKNNTNILFHIHYNFFCSYMNPLGAIIVAHIQLTEIFICF